VVGLVEDEEASGQERPEPLPRVNLFIADDTGYPQRARVRTSAPGKVDWVSLQGFLLEVETLRVAA
jgi:hypothetical protein